MPRRTADSAKEAPADDAGGASGCAVAGRGHCDASIGEVRRRDAPAAAAESEEAIRPAPIVQAVLMAAAAGVFVFFIYPSPLIDAAERAVSSLA